MLLLPRTLLVGTFNTLRAAHDFLRKLRAMVDEGYPGRVIIAEANQPPNEVDRPDDLVAHFQRDIVFERVSFRYGDGDLREIDAAASGADLVVTTEKPVAMFADPELAPGGFHPRDLRTLFALGVGELLEPG